MLGQTTNLSSDAQEEDTQVIGHDGKMLIGVLRRYLVTNKQVLEFSAGILFIFTFLLHSG